MSAPPAGVASGRNVLFVTVDQWRGDCLGLAGHPVVRTPTLDRLAGDGTWFRNHWASIAPCGPSRATLYTGLYAMNHRSVLNGTPLDRRFTNVALEARALGVEPVLFGYTDTAADPTGLPPDDPRLRTYEGVLPGFTPIVDFPFFTLAPWIDHLERLGYDVDRDDPHAIYRATAPGEPAPWAAEHSETAFLTDEVIRWLDGATEPWLAHVSYLRPHPPYLAPEPYHALVDPAEVPEPERAATREEEAAQHRLARTLVGMEGLAAPDDDEALRRVQATYYGMMAEVDDQLGRLLGALDASGAADRTLVVVTSDHGDQMGDHWLLDKVGYWDASYHVPLLVRDPSRPGAAGRVVDAPTEHVDLLPTIVEWLGGEVPLAADGRALLPFLDGTPPEDWRVECHWEWDFRSPTAHLAEDLLGVPMEHCCLVVLRDERWKYVHFAADPMPNLLFDLVEDPGQHRDLAADPAYAPVVAACAERLLSWRMRHADRTHTGTELTGRGPVTRRDPRR